MKKLIKAIKAGTNFRYSDSSGGQRNVHIDFDNPDEIYDAIRDKFGDEFASQFMRDFEDWKYLRIEEPIENLEYHIMELIDIQVNLSDLADLIEDSIDRGDLDALEGNVGSLYDEIEGIKLDIKQMQGKK